MRFLIFKEDLILDIFWMLLLQLALIGLNAVFACAEIAVLSVGDTKLERLAANGDKRARRLSRLTSQPARFLATIQVAITLSGFLGSAFAADNFAGYLVSWVISLSPEALLPHAPTLNAIAVVVITLVLSFITLVFGELVPKRLAQRKAEKIALSLSSLITGISRFFSPLVSLLTASTNGVLRLFGIDPNEVVEDVSEDDIRMMVDEGAEQGAIDDTEKEFIQNVFEFDDLSAAELATHRTDVDILWTDDPMEKWAEIIRDTYHAHYPVCHETVDEVVGVLSAKDYFRLDSHDRDTVMAKAVRPAYFVPSGVKADVLFRNMKQGRHRIAIVLDEWGGVVGIVSLNDLIEQLVGDFTDDETPEEEKAPDIAPLEDGSFRIRGTALIGEVETALGIELSDEDSDTIGGYALAALGAIPEDGTSCEVETEHLHILIENVTDHQIDTALVRVLAPKDDEDEDEAREKKPKDKDKDEDKDED